MVVLVDKSIPTVVALYDTILCSEGGRHRGPRRILLFSIAYGLASGVPLTNLVGLDEDVHFYITALIVATLARANETFVV